jgi:hypothetical protein
MIFPRDLALGHQRFNRNAQPLRGRGVLFEHLDLQWRVIGHDGVNPDQVDSLRMGHKKRGLYSFAPNIGKTPVESDMENILEGKMKRLDGREIRKAIEWLSGHGFSSAQICQNFVYCRFMKNAARSPDKETGLFEIRDVGR